MNTHISPRITEETYGSRTVYNRLPASIAWTKLADQIKLHLRAAVNYVDVHDEGTTPPITAIRADTGLGKTSSFLSAFNNVAGDAADIDLANKLRSMRILFAAPTLELADEVANNARAMGLIVRVFRGRSALQPGQQTGGERMCAKYEIAETLSAAGYPVSSTLCKKMVGTGSFDDKGREIEEEQLCPFASSCPYFQQLSARGPALIVTSHAYLSQNMESLREQEHIDMVITDESFFQTSVSNGRPVDLTDLCRNRNLPGMHHRYERSEHNRDDDILDLANGAEIVDFAFKRARARKKSPVSSHDYLMGTMPTEQLLIEDILEGFDRVCDPFMNEIKKSSDIEIDEEFLDSLPADMDQHAKLAALKQFHSLIGRKGLPVAKRTKPTAFMQMSEAERIAVLQAKASEFFNKLKNLEYIAMEKPKITPAMPEEEQRDLASQVKFRDALAFAGFWKRLAKEVSLRSSGKMNSILVRYDVLVGKGKDARYSDRAFLFHPKKIRYQNVPVLILDASASPEVIQQFFTKFDFVQIPAQISPFVRIRQCYDRTGSMSMYRKSDRRIEEVEGLMTWLAMKSKMESAPKADQSRDRRPLFVGYKSYHEDLWIEAGKAVKHLSVAGEQIVEWKDGSWSIGHANGLRGIDRFKYSSYIVVGARMQPKPTDVENIARAVFGNIDRELVTGLEEWSRRDHVLTAKDGTSAEIKVSYHPDELVEIIHKQICHEEIVQDVARGRLVHADEAKVVFLLTNIPLEEYGLQPDSIFAWSDLVPDDYDRWAMSAQVVPDRIKDIYDLCGEELGYSYPTMRKKFSQRQNNTKNFLIHSSVQTQSEFMDSKCELSLYKPYNGNIHISNLDSNTGTWTSNSARVRFRRDGCRLTHDASVKIAAGDTADHIVDKVQKAFPDAFNVVVMTELPAEAPKVEIVAEKRDPRIIETVLDIRFDHIESEIEESSVAMPEPFTVQRRIKLLKPTYGRAFSGLSA